MAVTRRQRLRALVAERRGLVVPGAYDAVSARLTTLTLRQLNAEVGGDTARVARVATAWLTEQGLR